MAVKISQLPSGSIPLSGGELLEMVQNGVSYSAPVSGIDHNTISNLQGGIPSASEYYHLSQSIHDGLYSASPTIGLGSSVGTNLEVDYGNHTIKADANTSNIMNLKGSTQQIGLSAAERIVVDQTNNAIQMTIFDDEQSALIQAVDIDGVSSIMYIGDQSQLHWRVGTGSNPALRAMSGTDVWFGIQGGSVNVGNATTGGTYINAGSTPRLSMNYKGDRVFQLEDATGTHDNRFMIGDWGTPSHNEITDVTIAASGAELTTKLDRIFASIGGTKLLNVDATTSTLGSSAGAKVDVIAGGAVELYHNGNKKFETSATGATATGILITDGVSMDVNEFIQFGAAVAGSGGRMFFDGSDLVLQNGDGTEGFISCSNNAAVALRYDNSNRISTSSTGALINGVIICDGLTMGDDEDITLGLGPDAVIKSDGTSLVISNGADTATMAKFTQTTAVELYYNNNKKFETTNTGATITSILNVGVDDAAVGTINLYGTDEDVGGTLHLYNAADADATAEFWKFQSEESGGSSKLIIHNNTGGSGEFIVLDEFTGNISLKYAGVDTFVTTSIGAEVTGELKHLNISTVTAQTTASNSDVILASAGGSFTLYLQDSTRASIKVKKINAANTLTVEGLNGTIDGAANKEITAQWESHTFIWDGTNWFIF